MSDTAAQAGPTGRAGGARVSNAEALGVALEAADLAIEIMHSTPRGEVRTKAHAADPVTDLDLATERAVRDHLTISA